MKHKHFLQLPYTLPLTLSFPCYSNKVIYNNQSQKIFFPNLDSHQSLIEKSRLKAQNHNEYDHYPQTQGISTMINLRSSIPISKMIISHNNNNQNMKMLKKSIINKMNRGNYQQNRWYTSNSYSLTLNDVEESILVEKGSHISTRKIKNEENLIENLVSSSTLPDNVKNRLQDGLKYGYFGDNLYLCHS